MKDSKMSERGIYRSKAKNRWKQKRKCRQKIKARVLERGKQEEIAK